MLEEGPETVGFGISGFSAFDELPQRRLVSVGSVESDPKEYEPFDVFRPVPFASPEPSIGATHAVLIVLPLRDRFVGS